MNDPTPRTAPPASPFAYAQPSTIAQACQPSASELQRRAAATQRAREAAATRSARASATIAPRSNARQVTIPAPSRATLSAPAQRLVDDLANPRSRTHVSTASQLAARLQQLSPADIQAVGNEARSRGWVGMFSMARGLFAVNGMRNQCTAAGGNPDDPATARRMFPIVLRQPSVVAIAEDIIRRAGG